jgi:hypothetical protein
MGFFIGDVAGNGCLVEAGRREERTKSCSKKEMYMQGRGT